MSDTLKPERLFEVFDSRYFPITVIGHLASTVTWFQEVDGEEVVLRENVPLSEKDLGCGMLPVLEGGWVDLYYLVAIQPNPEHGDAGCIWLLPCPELATSPGETPYVRWYPQEDYLARKGLAAAEEVGRAQHAAKIGQPVRRIRDTSPHLRKIDPEEVAKALGAELIPKGERPRFAGRPPLLGKQPSDPSTFTKGEWKK